MDGHDVGKWCPKVHWRHLAYASPLVRPEHRMQAIPEPSLTEPAGHAVHMAAGVDLPQHVCVPGCFHGEGKDAPTGCRAVGPAHSPVGDRPAAAPAAAPGRPAVAGVRPVVAGRRPAAAGGRRVRATAAARGGPAAARRDLVPRLARRADALPVAGACKEGEKGRVRTTGNAVLKSVGAYLPARRTATSRTDGGRAEAGARGAAGSGEVVKASIAGPAAAHIARGRRERGSSRGSDTVWASQRLRAAGRGVVREEQRRIDRWEHGTSYREVRIRALFTPGRRLRVGDIFRGRHNY